MSGEPDELQQVADTIEFCLKQARLCYAILEKRAKNDESAEIEYAFNRVFEASASLGSASWALSELGYTPQEVTQ